jgi:hypothetical protein
MKPVDVIVLIMVISVIGFLAAHLYMRGDEPVNPEIAKLIEHVLMAMLATVTLYVGSKINKKDD